MGTSPHAEGPHHLVDLGVDECWRLLHQEGFGRLAVFDGVSPDIFPVNYRVHDGTIVIRTEAGSKLAAATLMASVAFEVDGVDEATRHGWSVVVKGHGHEPRTVEDHVELEEMGMTPWVDEPRSRWLVIDPSQVTGRRIT